MRLVSGIYRGGYPFDSLPCVDDEIHTSNPDDLKQGDILVIWGGEDISPTLYGKPVSRFTGADEKPSRRDDTEWALMRKASALEIPIIGVCRGAQMLCAFAGGTLYQDVNRHGGYHIVETPDGYTFRTNSIHHQMMNPFNVKHEMLASIKTPLATHHYDVENLVEVKEEPEFVYFPEVKGYAVQWHPEAMDVDCEATKYIFSQIEARM